MKAVLISIQPKLCELIASGKKTIEVRKDKPTEETPFKCYIYCTKKTRKDGLGDYVLYEDEKGFIEENGVRFSPLRASKVIGEFVCDRVTKYPYEPFTDGEHLMPYGDLEQTGLNGWDLYDYLRVNDGYGWHISDLVIYDKPKELNQFKRPCFDCGYQTLGWESIACNHCSNCHLMTRPPQSWCYVEEI